MPDLTELLDATRPGPEAASDLDVDGLLRRARHRTAAARVGAGVGLAGIAALAILIAPFGPGTPTEMSDVVNEPSDLGPAGTWEQIEGSPLGPRRSAFAAIAGDGRLVVFGGASDSGDGNANAWRNDGAIYDPGTGAWERIEPAGDAAPALAAGHFGAAGLAADRLVALWTGEDGLAGTVYDLGERRWTDIPRAPMIEEYPEAVAWDGETLVLLQTGRRGGADRAPRIARWSLATGDWELGATPPFSTRSSPATAFSGADLFVWGGSTVTDEFVSGHAVPGAVLDGYVYDVADDAWRETGRAPVPAGTLGDAAWLSDTQVAVLTQPVGGVPARIAVFDTAQARWSGLPAGVPGVANAELGFATAAGRTPGGGVDRLVAVDTSRPRSYPLTPWTHALAIFDPVANRWVTGPDGGDAHVVEVGDALAVTTAPRGNPGDVAFGARVLVGERWRSADAPFVNRMDAAITADAERMYVFGGHAGGDIELMGDLWVLDLSETLDGAEE